jgi:hypothetical protein
MPKIHVNHRKEEFEKNFFKLLPYVQGDRLTLNQSNKEEKRLSNWLGRQKQRKTLSAEEKQMLSRLVGDSWREPRDVKNVNLWNQHFNEMLHYRREYHTWVISKNDLTNRKLYDWAAKQRKMWRDELLLPERKTMLLEAGFGFERSGKPQKKSRFTDQQEKDWDQQYDELLAYKARYGHCNVKCDGDKHRELRNWVILQRVTHRRNKLDATRCQRLEEACFVFEPRKPRQTANSSSKGNQSDKKSKDEKAPPESAMAPIC